MLTLISSSNKGNIVTYINSTNNGNNDRDSGSDSGSDSDGVNEDFNEGYNAKMICTQDKLDKLINYCTITSYISGSSSGDQLVPTSLQVKKLSPGLRSDVAICIKFTWINLLVFTNLYVKKSTCKLR